MNRQFSDHTTQKIIFIVLILHLFGSLPVIADETIDDFEGTFSWTGLGASPTVEQTSDIPPNGGASSMRIISSNPFNVGFGVGATRTFATALNADGFSSISYWIQSSNEDSSRTVVIQLADGDGTKIVQSSPLTLADALNTWVQVDVPLDLNGSVEISEAGTDSKFDLTNITQVEILVLRNGLDSDTRTLFVDDIEFIDQPSKSNISDLIDDFSPANQYNSTNLNDIGGFTDDDATFGPGNTNDRINIDGILSLTWNNVEDFWFTVFSDNGADISQNTHMQLRMRRTIGPELVTGVLRNSGNFTSEIAIPIPTMPTEFTTLNLDLDSFSPPLTRTSIKSFTLTFPGSPSGSLEIDQIVLSPHRRPSTIVIAALTPTTFENGQTIQLQIDLQDENGDPITDFADSVSLEVTDGAIEPSTISGFDGNGGSVTADFIVSATTGAQTITVEEPLVNVSSQLSINLSEPDNQDINLFDVEVPGDPVQFWGSIFPITITAKNSDDLPVGDNVGLIDIFSDSGSLVLLDSDGLEDPSVNMTQNPTTVLAFLQDPPDEDLSTVTLRVELISDTTKNGSATVNFKNSVSTDGELDFLVKQQDDSLTNLVQTDEGRSAAGLYSNALAVLSYVHKATLDDEPDTSFQTRAQNVLSTFQALQINDGGVNNGGFFDVYDLTNIDGDGNPVNAVTAVTSGNNAWLLMAINYYTIYTNDDSFLNMGVELGKFLQNRQAVSGGIFTRNTDTLTFVTEHQGEAYSALINLSQLNGVLAADALSFSTSAENIRSFLINELLESGRFDVAAGRSENTALDAQTSPFLGLPGPIVNDGMEDIDISTALDFVFTNIFKSPVTAYDLPNIDGTQVAVIEGPTFRELDPSPPCNADQFVWIEGAGQLALALGVLIDSEMGSQQDIERREDLLENIRKVRDPSGGFPTFLGTQLQCTEVGTESIEAGNDDISIVPAIWSYFNKVSPILNPYVLDPILAVKQDKVFIPGDGSSQVSITATLRQAGSVEGQNVQFDFESGNGTLDGLAFPDSIVRSTNTAGEATVVYTAGSAPDKAKITVSTDNPDTIVSGGSVSILQDFVDNFENGLEAGGAYTSFGSDFGLFDLVDATTDATLVNNGSFSGRLQTDPDGFESNTSFVGISKTFTVSSIDASAANAFSYWARGDGAINPPSVQIEFVMIDGSVWTQAESTQLTSTYQRISGSLDESDFTRSAGDGAFDKSMIKSVNFLLSANSGDTGGTQRTLYIDDIILFSNPRTLTLTQSAVFVPADGTTEVVVTATVLDTGIPPAEEVNLLFTILNNTDAGSPVFTESGTAVHSVTTTGGVASCTYRAGTSSTVAEISVEEQ